MSVHCSITVHWPHIGLQMTTLSVEAVSAIHCNFRWLNPASTSGEAFRSREIAPRVWCGTGSRGLMPLVCFNMMASFWAQWAKRNPLQIPILGPQASQLIGLWDSKGGCGLFPEEHCPSFPASR